MVSMVVATLKSAVTSAASDAADRLAGAWGWATPCNHGTAPIGVATA